MTATLGIAQEFIQTHQRWRSVARQRLDAAKLRSEFPGIAEHRALAAGLDVSARAQAAEAHA